MRDRLFNKVLILGIIMLLIITSLIPSISSIKDTNNVKDPNELIIQEREQIKEGCPKAFSEIDWWSMFHHDQYHTGYSTSDAPDGNFNLWTKATDWGISASPVVDDDRVYIGSSDPTAHYAYLYCLDALDGTEKWEYEIEAWYPDITTAAVVDDRVYFGGVDGWIYCLDANTGHEVWTYFAPTQVPCSIQSAPTVVDDRVYIGTGGCYYSDEDVLCLNASTGDLIWVFDAIDIVFNSPAVVDGKVYVGNDRLYCLNASNGSLIWNTTGKWFSSSPTVVDDRIYIGSYDGKVYCLDANSGDENWTCLTGDYVESTPAVAYGNVYVGSNDNHLYCLNVENGSVDWKYQTDDSVYSSPAVADDKIYVGSNDHYLYCLDAYDGDKIWSDETGGSVYSSPAIANGLVYVGSGDGKVYAFGSDFTSPKMIFEEPEIGYIYILGRLKIGHIGTKIPWPFLHEKSACIIHGGFKDVTVSIIDDESGVNESSMIGYLVEKPNAFFSLQYIGSSLYQGSLNAVGTGFDWTLKVEAEDNYGNPGSVSIKIFHYRNFIPSFP